MVTGRVTCCWDNLRVPDGRPAVVVLLSRGGLLRGVPEEAGRGEQTPAVFQAAGEPAVVLLGFLAGPADVDPLCAVATQLTVQLLGLHTLHKPPQVQTGSCHIKESQ